MNIAKIIRCFIVTAMFMCLLNVFKMDTREVHQMMFTLFIVIIAGLLLDNIWLTLFLWWTVFLYSYYKFQIGAIYVNNVFFGCMLYYLTKVAFKKEHIDFFINTFLWLVVLNLLYGIVQVLGLDWIWTGRESIAGYQYFETSFRNITWARTDNIIPAPMGFMGNTSVVSMLYVLAMPILMSKKNIISYISTGLMFLVLWKLHSSAALLSAGIVTLFMLWFTIPRKVWYGILAVSILIGSLLIIKAEKDYGIKDRISGWSLMMRDTNIHPITGWGLDSFRMVTGKKEHIYAKGIPAVTMENEGRVVKNFMYWDNPHNLYISLAFEWGFVALFLLGGYLRQCGIWFKRAIKEPNTVALAGFLLVFFLVSIGQFPMFLARCAIFLIPAFALFEIQIRS